jgi:hypothetical protein
MFNVGDRVKVIKILPCADMDDALPYVGEIGTITHINTTSHTPRSNEGWPFNLTVKFDRVTLPEATQYYNCREICLLADLDSPIMKEVEL